MKDNTLVTPESKTLKAIETVFALLFTVSTFGFSIITLFDGQHIKQTVGSKIGGKSVEVSTTDGSFSSAFRTCNHVISATRSLYPS